MDFLPPKRTRSVLIELTPLIDVVFLLLIFFMVSTTFVDEPSALEVDLPTSDSAAVIQEGDDLSILLTRDGRVLLDGESVDRDQLEQRLAAAAREDEATQVVLRADKELPYQELVDIMSLAHDLGLTHFSLATDDGAAGGSAASR